MRFAVLYWQKITMYQAGNFRRWYWFTEIEALNHVTVDAGQNLELAEFLNTLGHYRISQCMRESDYGAKKYGILSVSKHIADKDTVDLQSVYRQMFQ